MSDSDSPWDSDSDEDGGPPLEPIHFAVMAGYLAAMRRELEAGVSPDCVGYRKDHGVTPLLLLCAKETGWGASYSIPDDIRLEAVRLLLAAGASPDRIEEMPDESALCSAAYLGDLALCKLLIAAGADPTQAEESHGWTALHGAAVGGSGRHASCAVALLEAGVPVDAEGYYNAGRNFDTPLSKSLELIDHSPRSHVIPVLVRYGADIDRALQLKGHSSVHRQPEARKYLLRVQAAGGWKRYERAHRMRLTKTLARVAFPHVPTEVVSHIVDLWAHVGYY